MIEFHRILPRQSPRPKVLNWDDPPWRHHLAALCRPVKMVGSGKRIVGSGAETERFRGGY